MVQNERSSTPAFVTVTCACGRNLRAKPDQVGSEIRCWDCHQMVAVNDPNQGQRVARELSDGAMTVIKGPGLNSLLVGATLITAVLAIPYAGAWLSVVVLAMGASAFGQIIRQVSQGPVEKETEPDAWSLLVPRSIPKVLVCLLMGAGTVAPLWLLNSGLHQSPHLTWINWVVLALTWTLGPLLMLVLYARTNLDEPLGPRRCSKILARHPFATTLALAVVPITLFLVEVSLGVLIYLTGHLTFYTLDYMPMPTRPVPPIMYNGIPHYQNQDYRSYPESMFRAGYFAGLRHGYTFVGAIPPSLSMDTRAGMDSSEAIGVPWVFYLFLRLLITEIIVSCLLAAFAIQARWLGAIPSLERTKAT